MGHRLYQKPSVDGISTQRYAARIASRIASQGLGRGSVLKAERERKYCDSTLGGLPAVVVAVCALVLLLLSLSGAISARLLSGGGYDLLAVAMPAPNWVLLGAPSGLGVTIIGLAIAYSEIISVNECKDSAPSFSPLNGDCATLRLDANSGIAGLYGRRHLCSVKFYPLGRQF